MTSEFRTGVWIEVDESSPNRFYDIDLDGTPVQIHTDSHVGSGDRIFVRFVESSTDDGPGLEVNFTDPPTYRLEYCTGEVEFSMCPGPVREWTIRKAEEKIKLDCNGEVIFDINYHHANNPIENIQRCKPYWGMDFGATKFEGGAADYYRRQPVGEFFGER